MTHPTGLLSLWDADYNPLLLSTFAEFFPIFEVPAAAQVVFAAIDGDGTAFAELEVMAVGAFYYVTALLAFNLIRDDYLHAISSITSSIILAPNLKLFWKMRQSVIV